MSDDIPIGPNPCSYCGGEYGEHTDQCLKRQKMVGAPVTKEYAAKSLGFGSVEEMDAWYADPENIKKSSLFQGTDPRKSR